MVKAYRRALHRHHPDKLKANGLPDSMIEHAKQRTQQIIEAWELIRARARHPLSARRSHSTITSWMACTPSVSAAGPGCRMSADLISRR